MSKFVKAFFIFCGFAGTVFAQEFKEGYIIELGGDSIPGYVRYLDDGPASSKCIFKKEKKGNFFTTYRPGEIKAYGFLDDRYFVSKSLSKSGSIFLRVLLRGNITLYRNRNVYYIEPEGKALIPLKSANKDYVEVLNAILQECQLNASQISYNEKELASIIRNYNRCKGSAGVDYKQELPRFKLHYFALAGMDNSAAVIGGYNSYAIQKVSTVTYGIGTEISLPRFNKNAFATLDLWYVSRNYTGYYESTTASQTVRSDLSVSPSFLKIPLGVGYYFLSPANSPYVRAGVVSYFCMGNPKVQVLSETESGTQVYSTKTEVDLSSKNPAGFWFAAGFNRMINEHLAGFAEIRLENTSGLSVAGGTGSSCQNIIITIGLKL